MEYSIAATTMSGPIYRGTARLLVAPSPVVISILSDLGRRTVYPRSPVLSSIGNRHSGVGAFFAHAVVQGNVLAYLRRASLPVLVRAAADLIVTTKVIQNSEGCEGLAATLVNHLWFRAPSPVIDSLLGFISSSDSLFGARCPIYVGAVNGTISEFPGSAALVVSDGWRVALQEAAGRPPVPAAANHKSALLDGLTHVADPFRGMLEAQLKEWLGEEFEGLTSHKVGENDPFGAYQPSGDQAFWEALGMNALKADEPGPPGFSPGTGPFEHPEGQVPLDQTSMVSGALAEAGWNVFEAGIQVSAAGEGLMHDAAETGALPVALVGAGIAAIGHYVAHQGIEAVREDAEADVKAQKEAEAREAEKKKAEEAEQEKKAQEEKKKKEEEQKKREEEEKKKTAQETKKGGKKKPGKAKTPNPMDESSGATVSISAVIKLIKSSGGLPESPAHGPGGLPAEGFVEAASVGAGEFHVLDPLRDPVDSVYGDPTSIDPEIAKKYRNAQIQNHVIVCYFGSGMAAMAVGVGKSKIRTISPSIWR